RGCRWRSSPRPRCPGRVRRPGVRLRPVLPGGQAAAEVTRGGRSVGGSRIKARPGRPKPLFAGCGWRAHGSVALTHARAKLAPALHGVHQPGRRPSSHLQPQMRAPFLPMRRRADTPGVQGPSVGNPHF
ncbi:unnamed protein product, partial [Gulo gulo]